MIIDNHIPIFYYSLVITNPSRIQRSFACRPRLEDPHIDERTLGTSVGVFCWGRIELLYAFPNRCNIYIYIHDIYDIYIYYMYIIICMYIYYIHRHRYRYRYRYRPILELLRVFGFDITMYSWPFLGHLGGLEDAVFQLFVHELPKVPQRWARRLTLGSGVAHWSWMVMENPP